MSQSNPDEIGQIFTKDTQFQPTSKTKEVYILTTTDDEKDVFFCTQLAEKPTSCTVTGFQIPSLKLNKIKPTNYNEYITNARTIAGTKGEVKTLTFPWHRVHQIQSIRLLVTKQPQVLNENDSFR